MIASAARPRAPDRTTTRDKERARTVPGWRGVCGRNLGHLMGRIDMFRKLSTLTAAAALLAAVGFSGAANAIEVLSIGDHDIDDADTLRPCRQARTPDAAAARLQASRLAPPCHRAALAARLRADRVAA